MQAVNKVSDFGAIRPHNAINGFHIAEIFATAGTLAIGLGDESVSQIPGRLRIELWFLSPSSLLINPVLTNWVGGNFRYEVGNAELFGFFDANLGVPLKVRLIAKPS